MRLTRCSLVGVLRRAIREDQANINSREACGLLHSRICMTEEYQGKVSNVAMERV